MRAIDESDFSQLRYTKEPQLLWQSDSYLAVWKPHKMHSDRGASSRQPLVEWVESLYPQLGGVTAYGQGDCGLLYRLDFETAGVVLFARSQEAVSRYKLTQEKQELRKWYYAFTRELPQFPELGTITTHFKSYGPKGAEVRVVLDPTLDRSKRVTTVAYSTELIESLPVSADSSPDDSATSSQASALLPNNPADLSVAAPDAVPKGQELITYQNRITIVKGFRHQIRVHLAHLGTPIIGDPLYDSGPSSAYLELYCLGITSVDKKGM